MGGGRESKAPSPMTGSLRRFQEENESTNGTVLSEKKNWYTLLKGLLQISFSYGAASNFVRGAVLYPPWIHALLNYPFSVLGSGKALKDVIDFVKDTKSLSYDIGTVQVFSQTSLTYMYRE